MSVSRPRAVPVLVEPTPADVVEDPPDAPTDDLITLDPLDYERLRRVMGDVKLAETEARLVIAEHQRIIADLSRERDTVLQELSKKHAGFVIGATYGFNHEARTLVRQG